MIWLAGIVLWGLAGADLQTKKSFWAKLQHHISPHRSKPPKCTTLSELDPRFRDHLYLAGDAFVRVDHLQKDAVERRLYQEFHQANSHNLRGVARSFAILSQAIEEVFQGWDEEKYTEGRQSSPETIAEYAASLRSIFKGSGGEDITTQTLHRLGLLSAPSVSEGFEAVLARQRRHVGPAMLKEKFRRGTIQLVMSVERIATLLKFLYVFDGDRRRTRQLQMPGPLFLDFVNVDERQHYLILTLTSANVIQRLVQTDVWPSGLPGSQFRAGINSLKLYATLLNSRYGDYNFRYGPMLQPPKETSESEPRQPTTSALKQALALKKALAEYIEAFQSLASPRYDGLPNIHRSISPGDRAILLHFKLVNGKMTDVSVENDPTQPSTRLAAYRESRENAIVIAGLPETHASMIWALGGTLLRLQMSKGISVRTRLRTVLVCYWQEEQLRPRIMEILLMDFRWLESQVGDPVWLPVETVYDSESKPFGSFPPLEARELVGTYALAHAKARGILTEVSGQWIDYSRRPMCDLTEVYKNAGEIMSQLDYSFPESCIQIVAKEMSLQTENGQLYSLCLNEFPLGTRVMFRGYAGHYSAKEVGQNPEQLLTSLLGIKSSTPHPALTPPLDLRDPTAPQGHVYSVCMAETEGAQPFFTYPEPLLEKRQMEMCLQQGLNGRYLRDAAQAEHASRTRTAALEKELFKLFG